MRQPLEKKEEENKKESELSPIVLKFKQLTEYDPGEPKTD